MRIPEHEILNKLLDDQQLSLIDKGQILRDGICPECSKKTVWIGKNTPWMLRCDRETKCGYTETIKERYPELFSNWQERYPVTQVDPKATAKAYMMYKRGLDKPGFSGLYTQGKHRLDNGNYAPTVKFDLCPGMTWERLIEDADIAIDGSGKTRIKKHNKSATYKGQFWEPPFQQLKNGDEVFIVEGIFCALSLISLGKKAVVSISSNNIPNALLDKYKGKNITWIISYDNDIAGFKRIKKCVDIFIENDEKTDVYLTEKDEDWNDAYLANKINAEYFIQSQWRGRIFMAPTANHRAYEIYGQKPFSRQVFDFDGRIYSATFNSEIFNKNRDNEPFSYNDCREQFGSATTINCVSNCTIEFCYVEKDLFTEERLYAFKVKKAQEKKPIICRLNSSSINDPRGLSTAIYASTNGASIDLSSTDLKILHRRWFDGITALIEALQFIGFDEQSRSYVFPKFAYKNGRKYSAEKEGYIQCGDKYLRSNLRGIDISTNDDYCGGKWMNDFIKVFHKNGVASLAFFTASLFARQIKETHQSFTFFELTGEPGAGKSTVIRFLWKLFGRDNFEGVDLLSASEAAYGRHLGKLSNMPFVMIESDREADESGNSKGFNWDIFKKVFDLDGVIDARGVKTNDNQTSERIFRGTLLFSQNASVQASLPMMQRIVHMHCTTEHKNSDNIPLANHFETLQSKSVSGYLHNALKNEKPFLDVYFSAYTKHSQALRSLSTVIDQRVIKCHAQIMAAVDALTILIDTFTIDQANAVNEHLTERAIIRQQRLSKDHPLMQQFWDTYDYINNEYAIVNDEAGEHTVNRQLLNHSKNPSYIAINLNHYTELCREKGQRLPDVERLKNLFHTSQYHQFVGSKKVRSRLKNGALTRCWVFAKNHEAEDLKS